MSLRTLSDLFRRNGDDRTPEQIWEEHGCVGSAEYADCDAMSADYARLRRAVRRVADVLDAWEREPCLMTGEAAAEILRRVMKEAETDG